MNIDLSGLACPMPVIRLKKLFVEQAGQALDIEVTLTDQGALKDLPAFCEHRGLQCDLLEQSDKLLRFRIYGQL